MIHKASKPVRTKCRTNICRKNNLLSQYNHRHESAKETNNLKAICQKVHYLKLIFFQVPIKKRKRKARRISKWWLFIFICVCTIASTMFLININDQSHTGPKKIWITSSGKVKLCSPLDEWNNMHLTCFT